jgi:dCMP deaminase
MQCALFGNAGSTKDATLYSTFSPCIECSKMSLSVGIRRIVVLSDYAEEGAQLLNAGTIKLVKLDPVLLKPWTSSIYQEAQNHVLKQ